MTVLKIDDEKCRKDKFCSLECPMKIIRMGESGFPEMVDGAGDLCIECFHCVAVCPHAALTLDEVTPESCVALDKEKISSAQARNFMISRRSVRVFKEEAVDRKLLEECLDTARYAPTGHNAQPVQWTVIYDTAKVKQLAGLVADWMRMMIEARPEIAATMHFDRVIAGWENGIDVIVRGAQHIVIAHADRENLTSPAACSIALSHLELAAHSMGIGATWGGFFHAACATYPPLNQELKLPPKHQAFGAMLMGYNKHKYYRVPPRNEQKINWM